MYHDLLPYAGGARRRAPVRRVARKGAVPKQLSGWMQFLHEYGMQHPHLSRQELMHKAKMSGAYDQWRGMHGFGARRVVPRRKPAARRGRGVLGTVGNVMDSLFGLGASHTIAGRKRRVGRPRKARGASHIIAGEGECGGVRRRRAPVRRRRVARGATHVIAGEGETGGRVVRKRRAPARRRVL
jgi:hypothetical protein